MKILFSLLCFRKRLCTILLVPYSILPTYSQPQTGNIEIVHNLGIEHLVNRHISINDSLKTIPGYRIQLVFASGANGKKSAQEVQADFMQKYPDTEVYLIWDSPNYKVRAGDFRTRLNALKFQNEIKANFPNGYIVTDKINLPEIED